MIWPFAQKRHPVGERYLAACKARSLKDVDVAETTVVVIDAETTGFNIDTDKLLSLATIEVESRELKVKTARSWLIYQKDAPVNEAMKVHGILPSDTAEGQPEEKVIGELLELIGGNLVVGHHIAFDMAMLSRAAKKHFGIKLRNVVVDTALLAMQELTAFRKSGYANQAPPRLEDVCSELGLTMMDRHTAAGDAFTTGVIFMTLCAKVRQRLGRPVRYSDLPLAKV